MKFNLSVSSKTKSHRILPKDHGGLHSSKGAGAEISP